MCTNDALNSVFNRVSLGGPFIVSSMTPDLNDIRISSQI